MLQGDDRNVTEFERLLNDLNSAEDDFALQTDELVQQLSDGFAEEVYSAVFSFFEKHPNADCDAPSTLVHHVA